MAKRSLLSLPVTALLVATAFAGCMGNDGAPTEEPHVAAANESELSNVSVDDGTEEMDVDLGHMPHLHDYWQGKERVTIMDEDVEVDEFSAVFFTFIDVFRGTPGVGGTFFQFPEGSLVYEGTGQMEIIPTWSDPTVTGAGLRYRTPSSDSFTPVQSLAQGQPLVLDITPEMTDMPHDKESRWVFLLVPAQAGQAIVGNVHFHIDIIRMRDITLFPGHPELFHGANTLTLFDGAAKSSSQNFASQIVGFMTDNEQESGVRSSQVVPMETLSMTANVTITSATSNIGQVTDVDFLFKPAGSFRSQRAQVISADIEKGIYQFAWPVEMSETDSPYAKTSQWAFDLLIHSETANGFQHRRLADAQVDYQLQVVAYDSLLEGIEPAQDDEEN